MSTLYVDNLQPNLGSQVDVPNLKPLAGSLLQINYMQTATKYSYNGLSNWTNTAFTVTHTPKETNSIAKIDFCTHWSIQGATTCQFRFVRDGSVFLTQGAYDTQAADSGTTDTSAWGFNLSFQVIDPTANTAGTSVTYTLQIRPYDTSRTVYFNDTGGGAAIDDAGASCLTVMEIAQ